MDDIVKALTDFSADGVTSSTSLEEGNDDIIKALTDFSATDDTDVTTLDNDSNDTLPATTASQNAVVTVSYTQVNNRMVLVPFIVLFLCIDFNRVPVQHRLILIANSNNYKRY